MIKYLINKAKMMPLQGKVFYILVLAGLSFAIINTVINIILGLNLMTIITAIVTATLCLGLFIYAIIHNDYARPAFVGFLILICFIYPSLWIFNFGSKGPTPYFIIFNTILLTIICNNRKANILYIVQVLTLSVLFIIEIKYNHLIIGYESDMVYSLDLSLSFFLVTFFSTLIIKRMMKEYHLRISELHDLKEQFKKLSITDELTGIYNRRHIIQEINDKLEDDVEVSFSVIMIDIDDFKLINDQHGHGVGDEVIIGLGKILEDFVRPIDVVGRIGGEEFLIVLIDTTEDEARHRANAMKEIISEQSWSVEDLKVTISGGVYSKLPEDQLDDILERVDRYLYKAKNSGKNIII
jgi:diguanylate cyclase (GGDEF)-like protein